jgi:hypothetical protein
MTASKRGPAKSNASRIKVLFIAGFGPIVQDSRASRKLYAKALGIPFEAGPGGVAAQLSG